MEMCQKKNSHPFQVWVSSELIMKCSYFTKFGLVCPGMSHSELQEDFGIPILQSTLLDDMQGSVN